MSAGLCMSVPVNRKKELKLVIKVFSSGLCCLLSCAVLQRKSLISLMQAECSRGKGAWLQTNRSNASLIHVRHVTGENEIAEAAR